MKKYNMEQKIIQTFKELYYPKATSAVLVQDTVGEWFHSSVESVKAVSYCRHVQCLP